jgi:RPA family protein
MTDNYTREPAVRAFLEELSESTYEFKNRDGEMSPNYVLLPSGGRANRVLVAGTLMSIEDSSEDGNNTFWRARINDGTADMSVVAGQYQPEASQKLSELNENKSIPPAYVMVVGKPDVYTEDGNSIVSIKAENLRIITKDEKAVWMSNTLRETKNRLEYGEDEEKAEKQYNNRLEWLDDELLESLSDSV